MASQLYQKLKDNSSQIRILRVLPPLEPALEPLPIRCELEVVSLDEKPPYEAVSYAWGDPKDTRLIVVEGLEIKIRKNLEACLRYLRKPDKELRLWVDAICINQDDKREKSQQVAMMGDIFRSCPSAYIWLGVPSSISGTENPMLTHNGSICPSVQLVLSTDKQFRQHEIEGG
jgi:Heterokaryon incompatibility protein (HET)